MIDIDEYKFVIKVSFEDGDVYYNGAHYMLVGNPSNASRYKTEEAAKQNVEYACCQGGTGSVADYKEEKNAYNQSSF